MSKLNFIVGEEVMNKALLDRLAELIDEIVRDDTMRWTEKRDLIKEFLNGHEDYQTSFYEFIAWFENQDNAPEE